MWKVRDTKSFIKESSVIHRDKYDYFLVDYKRTDVRVKIICPKHGIFEQRPIEHLRGYGCQECGHESMFREPYVNGKRRCSKCGGYFELSYFPPNGKMSDGLGSACKGCANNATAVWVEQNIDEVIRKRKIYGKRKWAEYKEEHKEEFEQRAEQRRLLAIENKKRDKTTRQLRGHIRLASKTGMVRPHLLEVLGCTIDEFHAYIESLWTEGMSWDNYGYYGWHYDHIKPCASFDRDDPEDLNKCFHYTNYQPLWRKDNQVKNSTYNGIHYRRLS